MREIYNISALTAQNALKTNDQKFSNSSLRLSGGKKINNAKDNPAGLAMTREINAQIKSMQKANTNASDGINIAKTIDGVLNEVQEMLQRMNELAVRASTETLQSSDREYIQEEVANLKTEIQRVASTTRFNGQSLLDGNFDKRGYATIGGETKPTVKVSTFSDNMETGTYTIKGLKIDLLKDNEKRNEAYEDGMKQLDANTMDIKDLEVTDNSGRVVFAAGQVGTAVEVYGNQVRLQNSNGESITLQINEALDGSTDIDIELSDMGPMRVQTGVKEGQVVDLKIPAITLDNLGIRFTDCSEAKWARSAISEANFAIDYVSRLRSAIGAKENRLDNKVSSLKTNEENMTAAYSRIADVDMAEEMTEYSTLQVMTQAGISMLAQANQRPADVLQLLQ